MSLFPAYGKDSNVDSPVDENVSSDTDSPDLTWLNNPSFALDVSQIPLPLGTASTDEINRRVSRLIEDVPRHVSAEYNGASFTEAREVTKYSNESSKCMRYCETSASFISDHSSSYSSSALKHNLCFEDKSRNSYFGDVSSLSSLDLCTLPLGYKQEKLTVHQNTTNKKGKKKRKRMKDMRYYNCVLNEIESNKDMASVSQNNEGTVTSNVKWEEERCKQTAEYNQILAEHPHDVDTWLRYARYQDTILEHEKLYSRGNVSNRNRMTAERKLAILDRALGYNPDSVILLKEKFIVAEDVYTVSKISEELLKLLEKQQCNMILWQRYIETTQCALTLCTVSSVSSLYKRALSQLHQYRRKITPSVVQETEHKIVDLLMQFALFLRQSGLWEQLWMLLKTYLELNLNSNNEQSTNKFHFKSSVSEEEVTEAEDLILKSELPLSALWLRVEKFREGIHWLPYDTNDDCEDPQRLVFPEDVSDFIHPLTAHSYSFHLATSVLLLFKVPPLPCRHTSQAMFKFNSLSWSMDSVELLLAMYYPVSATSFVNVDILKDTSELTAGPQYLYEHLGQEHFLKFIIQVFQMCGECLEEPERMAIYVWWLRFEKFLVCLEKWGHCKYPQQRKKRLKTFVKEFLKLELNRNNILFYKEYALIEYELGNEKSALKMLHTAISAQQRVGVPVTSILNYREKSGLCSTYRTLCELLLYCSLKKRKQGNCLLDKKLILQVLVSLSIGTSLPADDKHTDLSEEQIQTALLKFHHITTEITRSNDENDNAVTGMEFLLPDFFVDWITCHAWLLFLSRSLWDACAFILEILTNQLSSGDNHITLRSCRREALFESYVTIVHYHCVESGGAFPVLREVLHHALEEFPNNVHFLAVVAQTELGVGCVGRLWWKLSHEFMKSEHILPQLLLVFLSKQKQRKLNEASILTHRFLERGGPVVPDDSFHNHIASLFKKLLNKPYTKHCPLLWRMYLQFLFHSGEQEKCRAVFYNGIENCPWAKALYMDAATYVPEELPQIQDLLVEKELRLHVTPEELDILRSDTTDIM